MPDLDIKSAFVLTLRNGERRHFCAGLNRDVPDEIAEHWYVKAHTNSDSALSPGPAEPDEVAETPVSEAGVVVDKATLLAQAKDLGITVDGRWSVERLKAAIEAAKG